MYIYLCSNANGFPLALSEGVLLFLVLGLANSHLVARVVAAGFLKHLVLIRTEDGGLGGECLGQNQGVGTGGNGNSSHVNPLSGAWPLFFISKVVCPSL